MFTIIQMHVMFRPVEEIASLSPKPVLSRSRERLLTPLHFCWLELRDFIQNSTCDPNENSWNPNFILFGGSRLSNEKITLYNYVNRRRDRVSTNLFLNNDVTEPHLFQQDEFLYIPGNTVLA